MYQTKVIILGVVLILNMDDGSGSMPLNQQVREFVISATMTGYINQIKYKKSRQHSNTHYVVENNIYDREGDTFAKITKYIIHSGTQ